MRKRTIALAGIALAAGSYLYLHRGDGDLPPPEMRKFGETSDGGLIVETKRIDYESVVGTALNQRASFITLTVARDVVRDQHLDKSIRYLPFPTSQALVQVTYHVEYAIGYELGPGRFAVAGDGRGLVITLHRPQLVAPPSVRLLSFHVLDSGYLIDEKTALLELQQRIEPEAEKRAAVTLKQPDIVPRSERALRGFLQPLLARAGNGGTPPPIAFEYR